ncbi:MAG TPA: decaprenyl-phosphate phosphoribosyltransferase [Pyrinomonadaceae bacterium]|nr:decaprenyl-phosphate phosphoribosyltransferase [Pyrinomonadaceae bacterium]
MNHPTELWRLLRPRQWVKSSFVLIGMLFAKAWHEPRMLRNVLLTAVAFSLVASGVYVFNDVMDRAQDAAHPKKRFRPLAAATVSTQVAFLLLALLLLAGLALGVLVSTQVLILLALYLVINLGYSLGLKNIVLLDVFLIAGGFMLRILAGTLGVGIAPSQWLLLCGLMLALFLGFAKRRAELYALPEGNADQRKVLKNYHAVWLDKMIVITATCVILTYSLYTMSDKTIQVHRTEALIYTAPFVMYAIFRYLYTLHHKSAGLDPAQEIFRDPHILLSITGWLLLTLWLIS